MFHRAFFAVVAATASMLAIAILAVGATPAVASPAPPPAAPPGLTGEVLTMTQANPDGTRVDCVVGTRAGSASFAGSGFATGPYPGTFTANGTVSTTMDSGTVSGTFDETFTITSPAGTVTGTKSGALPADTSSCISSTFAADNAMLHYQATIATADGNFMDSGTSQALLEINTFGGQHEVIFGETFSSQGVVPIVPTSKDQCKDGGWQQYPQFRNQGDCVSFVETGR
jgi:hypothetical protein